MLDVKKPVVTRGDRTPVEIVHVGRDGTLFGYVGDDHDLSRRHADGTFWERRAHPLDWINAPEEEQVGYYNEYGCHDLYGAYESVEKADMHTSGSRTSVIKITWLGDGPVKIERVK